MQIFTDGLIEAVVARYASLTAPQQYEVTYLYWIVVEQAYSFARQEIEAWAEMLPPGTQRAFVQSIKNLDPQAMDTYHELVVRDVLRLHGYQVTYSPSIGTIRAELGLAQLAPKVNGLTPDWFARTEDGTTAFIVEVFTTHVPGHQSGNTGEIQKLEATLREIALDVHIGVSLPRNDVRFDRDFVRDCTRLVEEWLRNDNPQPGASLQITSAEPPADVSWKSRFVMPRSGISYPADVIKPSKAPDNDTITFTLWERQRGYEHVQVHCGSRSYFVEEATAKMGENILGKIAKYAPADLPLVVAAVADPITGLAFTEFEDAVLGDRTVVFGLVGKHNGPTFTRKANGVLLGPGATEDVPEEKTQINEARNALTAVILLGRPDGSNEWQTHVIYNETSRFQPPTLG